MKIYLVETSSVYYGDDEVEVLAFDTLEKAKASFDERVNLAKTTDHLVTLKDAEDLTVEETDTTFELYETGCYSEDHISVRIVETDLK